MKSYTQLISLAFAVLGASTALAGGISMQVIPSVAPNFFGSPSWNGYQANAMTGLENGMSDVGPLNDPTHYTGLANGSAITAGQVIVTSYNSWEGVISPAAPFNNELGNRLHFGLVVMGDGQHKFSLNELTFNMTSNDPGNGLGYADNFLGLGFSDRRLGINFGADGQLGGGDDTVYNSANPGNDSTQVDALYYIGVGNAFWPSTQADMGSTIDYIYQNVSAVDITYTLATADGTYTGAGSVSVVPVPAAVWSGGAMLALLAGQRIMRRRRARSMSM